jgi:hypothetical protein
MPPARLPNALIYLSSLLRPRLRPEWVATRTPTRCLALVASLTIIAAIANVDFRRLRQEKGFNAVVVDKDNCVVRGFVDKIQTCRVADCPDPAE